MSTRRHGAGGFHAYLGDRNGGNALETAKSGRFAVVIATQNAATWPDLARDGVFVCLAVCSGPWRSDRASYGGLGAFLISNKVAWMASSRESTRWTSDSSRWVA